MGNWMRRYFVAGLAAMLLSGAAHAGETTYIKAGSLFDSRSGKVSRDAVIVVEDDRITAVGGSEIDIPDDGIRFEDVERAMILSGLHKAKGSQSDAARLLGLTRDTLRYRLEKFGIN